MCEHPEYLSGKGRSKSPQEQLAELLFRDLRLAYPVMPGDVKSMVFARWETLKTLAHAIHEQDRRSGSPDRRS